MKRFSSPPVRLSLACLILAAFPAIQLAQAQPAAPAGDRPVQGVAPEPSGQRKDGTQAPAAAQATPQPATQRERRAQAYAKLLEGQRYMSALRGGISANLIHLAQQAFQQSATLDPTLAEAHTALAELAFFYPPQDFPLAEREAAIAARIDPGNLGAHRLLSRIYAIKSGLRDNNLDRKAAEQAIVELREVARLEPTDAEAWALLGEFYYAMGKTREAIEAWTRWVAATPSSDPRIFQFVTNGRELTTDAANARLGEAFIAAGRTTEAIAAIRRAIALNPENKEYSDLLNQAFESGASDTNAIAELQRMVTDDPSNTAVVRLLGRVQARAGRIDEAAATLRAAIARRPKGDREQLLLRLYLAQIFSDALRYDEAIAVFEELLKERNINDSVLNSDDDREIAAVVLQRILNLQKIAGRTAEVTATIERMRRLLGPADPTAEEERIDFLRNQGQRQEALAAIRSARLRFPEEAAFVNLEAATLTDLGRVDEAMTLLRGRLKGSLEDFDTYRIISALNTQAGRGRQAIEAARKMLELAPAERQDLVAAALITLSSAQEGAGDTKGSEESLRRVLAREPNNATALNNLGYFLVERNERLDEALEMIQRAVRAEPTNSSFLDSLGWAYFKLGKLDEAERHLSEAARRDAASATIHNHLGDLYQRRGRMEQARAAWQKALALAVQVDEITKIKAKLDGQGSK
ncbi:MAG TPA: tetratricopeptide repeat protein [Pyrinomonadaceae bacterium]|nr:tetratricopeptide repeat protein [Pyrinomonadaceae bacterium]